MREANDRGYECLLVEAGIGSLYARECAIPVSPLNIDQKVCHGLFRSRRIRAEAGKSGARCDTDGSLGASCSRQTDGHQKHGNGNDDDWQ